MDIICGDQTYQSQGVRNAKGYLAINTPTGTVKLDLEDQRGAYDAICKAMLTTKKAVDITSFMAMGKTTEEVPDEASADDEPLSEADTVSEEDEESAQE